MNQPQQLSVACNFQGFLVCQMSKDVVEVELKIKTKWGKFTLHTDQNTRTEKYRLWKMASHHRIHCRRRLPCHKRPNEHQCSTDSGTFINSGQRMGYPHKTFIVSDTDDDIPPHIPDLKDFCRTCLTRKVRCTCKPMSNWSADLIYITQPDPPNPDSTANNDRDDGQDQVLPCDWSDQDNFWLGKTYDNVRLLSSLKPVPVLPPSNGDEDSNWSKHLHSHHYRAKAPLQVSPSKPPLCWPKGIRTNQNTTPVPSQRKTKDQGNMGCILLRLQQFLKRPLKP